MTRRRKRVEALTKLFFVFRIKFNLFVYKLVYQNNKQF